jgi:hypothetical protein
MTTKTTTMPPLNSLTSRRAALAQLTAAGAFAGLASLGRAAEPAPLPSSSPAFALNVREFGAKADAATDDTGAFQKALDAAGQAGGGVVFVPTGNYLFKGTLLIPRGVTLEGVWTAPARTEFVRDPADPKGGRHLNGSVLLATAGKGEEKGAAFIRMQANATLKGLTIFYPEQTKANPPFPYPWTVQTTAADDLSLVDVLMVNPYQAVDFGSAPAGRHYIRGLYAQALRRGLFIDHCLDVGRVENVHLWPFWTGGQAEVDKFTLAQGEAFILGRSDWQQLTGCFCISYDVGFRFVTGRGSGPYAGPGNHLITGGGADMCHTAVLVEETQGHSGVSFVNAQIFGDVVVKESNHGPVRFTGCGFFGSVDGQRGTALAKLAGPGRVSFSNCHFYCIHPESRNAPEMIIAESGRLAIQGCVFMNNRNTARVNSNPVPIVLKSAVRSAIIEGNEFYGQSRIVNQAKGQVVLANNLEETDEKPFPERKTAQ